MADWDHRSTDTRWRVFVSHTSELRNFPAGGKSYIAETERAISAAGHAVVDMANFPGADQVAAELCADRVRGCDVYVAVLGTRYGSPVRDRPEVSYTELEFDAATAAGLPRLVFLLNQDAALPIPVSMLLDSEPDLQARQRAFRERLADVGIMVAQVATPEELELKLLHALQENRLQAEAGGPGGRVAGLPAPAEVS